MLYASQFGEIAWLWNNRHLPDKGIFVEVGASDGIENSNSFELERRGWTGILIEPDPRSLPKLRANRPNSVIEACAIASVEGDDAKFYLNAEPTWSGLSDEVVTVSDIRVKARRLDTILAAHGIRHIDLLSLDTEGTELDAWASRGMLLPEIVVVEFLTVGRDHAKEIAKQFQSDGYYLLHQTAVNFIYKRGARA